MRLAFALVFAVCWMAALGQTDSKRIAVPVGATTIVFPIPRGYSQVEPRHAELYKVANSLIGPGNRLLAFVLDSRDLDAFERGGTPAMDRYFLAQISLKFEQRTFSLEEFAQLRQGLRQQQIELLRSADTRVSDLLRRVEKGLAATPGSLKMEVGDLVPLGITHDYPSTIAIGSMVSLRIGVTGSSSEDRIQIGDISYVLVKGRLVRLYTYAKFGTAADIDWTKQASTSWSQELLAANK